ncbi:MAG: thioredoxin family protein [Candidatus Berkelbacteria bacterium]|nr:thioredoxin family protein [Candidatus Berkelbacteria bacterium]
MTLKIFTQPSCPDCPPAKKLGKKLEDKIKVEYHDISTPKGLAEAASLDVMATPTLILLNDDGKVKKTWPGTFEDEEIFKEIAK